MSGLNEPSSVSFSIANGSSSTTAKSLFNTYKKELNLLEEQIQALKESNLLLLYCVLMDIVENNYSGMENSKVDYDGNLVK